MEETSDGTIAMKCKLRTIVRDEALQLIMQKCAKNLSKIIYKANILFRLYVFYCVDHKIHPVISKTQINRCINLIKNGSAKLRAGRFASEVQILHMVMKEHAEMFKRIPTPDFKSASRPLEYAATEMYTNIGVQISEHFERYQRRYIRYRLGAYLTGQGYENLTQGQIGELAFQLQKAMNKNLPVTGFISNHFPDSQLVITLIPHLNIMAKVIHNDMPKAIHKVNLSTLKSKKNYSYFVIYMHQMAKYLQDYCEPSFTPLPNQKLQRRSFLFDKRFLCAVYNKWSSDTIGIKDFEKDYAKYYHLMFRTYDKDMFKKLCDRREIPKSYITNGYTVSIIFSPDPSEPKKEKPPSHTSKSKKKSSSDVKEHPDHGTLKPGLYNADNLQCDVNQLSQYHFTSMDPGNQKMFTCVTYANANANANDYGDSYVINKGYYNEISHITRNTRKRNEFTESNKKVLACHAQLSEGCLRGGRIKDYLRYINIIIDNWDVLWKHELDDCIPKLSYDTYLHSKIAVAKICKEIRKRNPTKKPSLYIIGKGNGRMTISNTKNSSSHGPIKRIVHALSLLEPVVLVDEYKTSKLCNECFAPLTYPRMHFRKKLRRLVKEKYGDMTKEQYKLLAPKVALENAKTFSIREVHGACYCSNTNHQNKHGHSHRIVLKRDVNSGRCIFRVAVGKLTGNQLEAFQRTHNA
jgi:hypothetical protein